MKTLNARLRIGFMDMKEVQFHWVTPSENWLLGQSTLGKLCSSAAALLHVGHFEAYFLVSCSEQ